MYSRKQALRDAGFLRLRNAKMNGYNYQRMKPSERQAELEKQLGEFVRLKNAQEHYRREVTVVGRKIGHVVKEIKERFGFNEHPLVVKWYCQGKQTPRNLSLKIFQPKTASLQVKTRFDNEMSELTGHYLFGTYQDKRGFHASDSDRFALDRMAGLVEKKTGKAHSVNECERVVRDAGGRKWKNKFCLLEVRHAGLNAHLLGLTDNARKIPFEMLAKEEHRLSFLRGAFARPGGSVCTRTPKKEQTFVGLSVANPRKKHLVTQLALLLTHHGVFPRVDEKRGAFFVEGRQELEKLLEMKVLPKDWHEKLSGLLETVQDRTRSEPIELYEEFHKRLHEERPVDGLGLSCDKITRWRRIKSRPDQVNRYLKLRGLAGKLSLPIKNFQHTIQAEEERGVRGKILSSEKPVQQTAEETALKRRQVEEALGVLTQRQRKAVEEWLAGGKMKANAVEGLRKIRQLKSKLQKQ